MERRAGETQNYDGCN